MVKLTEICQAAQAGTVGRPINCIHTWKVILLRHHQVDLGGIFVREGSIVAGNVGSRCRESLATAGGR